MATRWDRAGQVALCRQHRAGASKSRPEPTWSDSTVISRFISPHFEATLLMDRIRSWPQGPQIPAGGCHPDSRSWSTWSWIGCPWQNPRRRRVSGRQYLSGVCLSMRHARPACILQPLSILFLDDLVPRIKPYVPAIQTSVSILTVDALNAFTSKVLCP